MPRLSYPTISPEGYAEFMSTAKTLAQCGLEESLIHIVYLRVSQINGCPYCIDLHWKDAVKIGEDARKLNSVIIWRDAKFFNERERAALEWAEAITLLKDQEIIGRAFDNAKLHFNDKEVVDLAYLIAHMNSLNRVAIAFHVVAS